MYMHMIPVVIARKLYMHMILIVIVRSYIYARDSSRNSTKVFSVDVANEVVVIVRKLYCRAQRAGMTGH